MSNKKAIPAEIRELLPKRCCGCGLTENLTYHHIFPEAFGGKTTVENLAVMCGRCHYSTLESGVL